MSVLSELAAFFDKAAEEEECKASAPPSVAAKSEHKSDAPSEKDPAKEAAEVFRDATGSDIDADLAQKLAADPAAIEALRKLAEVNRRPERLGGASDRQGFRPSPKTATERTQTAYDRFGQFLVTGERSNP